MAGGMSNFPVGYAAYAGIKLAGYSAFARWELEPRFGRGTRGALAVGAARTVLGMTAGALFGALLVSLAALLSRTFGTGPLPFVLVLPALAAVRWWEWWLTIRVFYDRPREKAGLWRRSQGLGIAVSFLLDVPAWLGLITFGQVWVC